MRAIPQEVKEQQGTFEPSKEPLEPIQLQQYERNPAAPEGWPPRIQKTWNDLCTDLKKAGYLARVFIPGLRVYCFALLQRDEAEQKLLEEGFTIIKSSITASVEIPSPWLSVLDQANKTIEKFGAKYGFTPLDVQKIPAVKKAEGKEMSLLK
jgi:P27 family predicted phage terminase small subunit